MTSSWRRLASGAKVDDIAPAGVVGASINDGLKALVDDDKLMRDPAAYKEAVQVMAKDVVALPKTKKKAWRRSGNRALTAVDYSRVRPMTEVRADRTPFHVEIRPEVRETAPAPTVAPKARAKAAMKAITEQDVTVEVAAEHIGVLVAQIMEAGFNPVLALASHKLGGRLEGNLLNGDLWLQNDVGKPVDPTTQAISKVSVEGRLVTVGDDLHLSGNEMQRLVSYMASGKVDSGVLKQSVEGYRVLTVSDNLFLDQDHSFIAGQLSFQGNHFPAVEPEELLGLVLSNRSTLVANVAGHKSARIQCAAGALAQSANLLTLQPL